MAGPRTGRAAVEIVGEVSNFGADVERELNKELRGVDLDVRPVADDLAKGIKKGVDEAGRSFDGLSAKAKTSLKGVGEEAEAAGEGIHAGVRKGTDKARDEFGRFIASGKKTSDGITLGFGKLSIELGTIGKIAGKALAAGLAVGALAQTTQTVAGLVTAIVPMVGVVGLLPAAFIAAKVAAGAFQIAMLGVADAVTAGITGDTAAFNEALKAMPPAAQAAIKEIVSLKTEILAIRETVQGNFFQPLIGQLQPLGALYLPLVRTQLGNIATGFGEAAASTASFLRLPSSVKSVNSSLSDTTTAVNNVSAGLPGLVRAFLPLWEVGASFLPGLTAEFDGLTQRIGAFMEKARETGQLQEFISGGLSALGQLGSILANVGSILGSVFEAAKASGGDLLGVVGEAVGKFAEFLNTAQGMQALTSIFEVLGGVAGLFGQALSIVLPVLGTLVGVLAGALKPLLPVISNALTQMAPVIAQVGEALGAILGPAIGVVVQLLSTLLPVIIPIVSALMSSLMPVIKQLAPVITQLGTTISTILVSALTALAPVFQQLLPVISEILVAVLIPLIPVIAQIGDLFVALMPALTPVIQLLVNLLVMALKPLAVTTPLFVQALGLVISAMTKFVTPIAQAIGFVAQWLAELVRTNTVMNNVKNAFTTVGRAAATVFGAIKTVVVGAWNVIKSASLAVWGAIRSYITTQINLIKAVLNGIGAAVTKVIGFFNRMKSQAMSALGSFKSGVSSAVSTVVGYFGRLVTGATGKISSLISTVRGIGGRIRSAVGNLASLLVGAGRNVIQGLINGITQKLGALRAKAASAAASIRNLFPFSPAKEGPLSGKGSPELAGRKIVNMIAAGMERRIPEIRDSARRIADETLQGPASGRGADKAKTRKKIIDRVDDINKMREKVNTIRDNFDGGSTGGGGSGGGDGGPTYIFASGSIVLNFYGMAPGDEVAYAAGRAAGRGLASAFAARDVRTEVRTI